MPDEPYSSPSYRKAPFFETDDLEMYDLTAEQSIYAYRDLKDGKVTPIRKELVEECITKITEYLADENHRTLELERSSEICKQPDERICLIATILLVQEGKVWIYERDDEWCLKLPEDYPKPIEIAGTKSANYLRRILENQKRRAREEYKQHRER